jgi:hypothetical protein
VQLRRSILALFLLLAYFSALLATVCVSSLALALKLFLSVACLGFFLYFFKKWRFSAARINVMQSGLQFASGNSIFTLAKIQQYFGYGFCCSIQENKRKIIIWQDQLSPGDYRYLKSLLLALE